MGFISHHARTHELGTEPLDHIDVEITVPIDGEVLTFDDSTLKWVNRPGGGGGGAPPGDTVVPETAWGQSPTPGVGTPYSRSDHTHGSPVDPIPPHVAEEDPHLPYKLLVGARYDGTINRDENGIITSIETGELTKIINRDTEGLIESIEVVGVKLITFIRNIEK